MSVTMSFLKQTNYDEFLKEDRYDDFDPRPPGKETTNDEIDWFINR